MMSNTKNLLNINHNYKANQWLAKNNENLIFFLEIVIFYLQIKFWNADDRHKYIDWTRWMMNKVEKSFVPVEVQSRSRTQYSIVV